MIRIQGILLTACWLARLHAVVMLMLVILFQLLTTLGKKILLSLFFRAGVSDLPKVSSRTTISQLRFSHFAATEMSVREERP